jgi:signal transduction histidine kinase
MVKQIFVLISFLLSASLNTHANNLDSLFIALKNAKKDSQMVKIMNEIGISYGIEKSDSAFYYFENAKKISERINYPKGIIYYYTNSTELYNSMGKYDTSLLLNMESIGIAEKLPNRILLANCFSNTGNSFLNLQKYDSAIIYFLKAETILLSENDLKGLLILYGNVSGLYSNMGQNEKAKYYILKAVEINNKGIGDNIEYMFTLTNLAAVYLNLNINDSVYFFANEALILAKENKSHNVSMANLQNIIYAKINQHKYNEIFDYVKKMDELKDRISTPKYFVKLNMNYAFAYYYTGNQSLAEQYALKALEISEKNNLVSNSQQVCSFLTKIESALGNFALADKYNAKSDSIYEAQINEGVASNIKELENKYETQKKDNEIYKLNTANKEKSTLNSILIGSTVGIVVISLLGYRNFKSRQKLQQQKITDLEKDKQLSAIDAMLKGQEEERSRIAKDLHDGLGGMLSGTKLSFINMKENLVLTPENAILFDKSLSMLDNTISDLRKVAHNLMPEALVKYGLDDALRDFCNTIQSSSAIKVLYQYYGEKRKLSNTAEVFIYRIIQELVNNALKHANASQIIVQLITNTNKVGIAVEDNGSGFDLNNIANKKSAGMDNIRYRVHYFNGTIDTVTSPGNGTSVNIELIA